MGSKPRYYGVVATELNRELNEGIREIWQAGQLYGDETGRVSILNKLHPLHRMIGLDWQNANDWKREYGDDWFDKMIEDMEAGVRAFVNQYEQGVQDGRMEGAQVLHDIRGILGFDNDGDMEPHPPTNRETWWDEYKEQRIREAEEFRKEYDDLLEEEDVPATVIALAKEPCERYKDGGTCLTDRGPVKVVSSNPKDLYCWPCRLRKALTDAGHAVQSFKPGTMDIRSITERSGHWLRNHQGEDCETCGMEYVLCIAGVLGRRPQACCARCAEVDTHNVKIVGDDPPFVAHLAERF